MKFFRSATPTPATPSTPGPAVAETPAAPPAPPLPRYLAVVVAQGSVSPADAAAIVTESRGDLGEIEKAIVGRIGREPFVQALKQNPVAEWIDLAQVDVQPEVASSVLPEIARSLRVACVGLDERGLQLAMAEPENESTVETVEKRTSRPVSRRFQTLPSDLARFQRYLEDPLQFHAMDPEAVFDRMLEEAMAQGVSDVHIEPLEETVRVRFRKGGTLVESFDLRSMIPKKALASHLKTALPVVLKSRAGASQRAMNLSGSQHSHETRIHLPERRVDLRVSMLPTLFGESIVIRIKTQDEQELDISQLGLNEGDLRRLLSLTQAPGGILVAGGPIGCGKTTTLYTLLRSVNHSFRKIMTIEEPIEYVLPGVLQCPANPARNFGFSEALRAFLRHDPDVVMVGEIRDQETAAMAVETSLAGRLVLTTLHAHDAVSSLTRLQELGIHPLLLTSTCLATVSQRLVRLNCPHCLEPGQFSRRFYEAIDRHHVPMRPDQLKRGAGCPECHFSGYLGRAGVFELLVMTPEIRELVIDGAPADKIEAVARGQGMKTLLEEALTKAAQGLTTEAEVWRITVAAPEPPPVYAPYVAPR